MEQASTCRGLELVPAPAGQDGHLHVVGLGVAETEDAGVALGARPLVARLRGRLQDLDAPAPAGQGPGGGEAEKPRADHDATAVVGHVLDHTNAPGRTWLPRGPAVRSATVTRGMDVSTHPLYDTSPGEPGRSDAVPQTGATTDVERGAPYEIPGRAQQVVRTVGFHLLALACFTVPAILLWWHVWSGHPSSVLTCGCGDPAQEVWFMAWPAWAIVHAHSVFFSGAVNVPHGANLLSNTSGPLVGVVLAPVTWLFGPVAATNVALTLAPALSAWACFAAIRPLVRWKVGAIPAALVYGYSSAIITSIAFGHVSVTILVIPPFLFTTLHEIVIRQEHSVRRDGLLLAGLLVAQFFISAEILVMCLLLTAVGLLVVMLVGWRQLRPRAGHALPALGLAAGVTVVLLAYPAWYGLSGPQAVSGTLFALAPIAGVPFSGLLVPGAYGAVANAYQRFGGYLGRSGPPPDYVGWGVALASVGALVVGRRRPLTWLLLLLAAATFWLTLGAYLLSGPTWLGHPWLPWKELSTLPVLKEILPDQFVPLLTLFLAFLIALGLDALHGARGRSTSWSTSHRALVTGVATAAVGAVALVPVFMTFDAPLRVVPIRTPAYLREATPTSPGAAHHSLCRLGIGDTDVVASRRGHALPPGRRRTQDPRRPGRPGRLGPAGVGPPHPDQSDAQRGATAHGDRAPAGDRAACAGRLAGGRGGGHGRQPGPGLRLGVLHHGARCRTGLRARRLGVEAGSRRAHDLSGHRQLPVGLPGIRRRARPAGGPALHGQVRPLRGRPRRLSGRAWAAVGSWRAAHPPSLHPRT